MTKTSILAMFGASAIAAAVLVVSHASVATAAPAPKVTICHIDQDDVVEGEPSSVVISVSSNALDAHLAHGDYPDPTLIVGSVNCAVPVI
jgi:hypothetical protein